VGCFGGRGKPKALQQPGEPEEIFVEATAEIPLEMRRAVTAEWPEHLKACVKA